LADLDFLGIIYSTTNGEWLGSRDRVEANMAKARRQSKPGGESQDRKEAIIYIPLTFNDGTKVPEGTIRSICQEMYDAYNGWTMEGKVKGAYRMRSTGKKRVEELMKASLILDESQIPELEGLVARWCARLGQETMLLKITDTVIKFVPPRTAEESS
jgi:hypothetical protein